MVHVQTPFPLMSPAVFVAADQAGVAVVATSQSFRYSCVKATMLRDGRVCEDCVGRRIKYPAVVHRCYKDSLAGSLTMVSTLAVHGAAGTFAHRVDRHIALTPFMRERLIAEGISPEKVVVIPHTPPDPGSPAPERDGYALFVGRFVPEKGILTVLQAWERQGLDLPLVIVGDGVLRPEVEAAAARHGGITVRPWLDPSEVAEVMARAEVLLMTSEWYEGFGVVITEAYAAGTPVIASNVGNFSEMIDPRVTGERYRCADPVDLARAVRWFFAEADRGALENCGPREVPPRVPSGPAAGRARGGLPSCHPRAAGGPLTILRRGGWYRDPRFREDWAWRTRPPPSHPRKVSDPCVLGFALLLGDPDRPPRRS